MIIYSFPKKVGSIGIGNLMYQQCLSLYDAGLLQKIYAIDSIKSIIPERLIEKIEGEDIDFDKKISDGSYLAKEVEKNPDVSFLGMRSFFQQNKIRGIPGFNGKILKYCGSSYPTIKNSIIEKERISQSGSGIIQNSTDYNALRYDTLECEIADKFICPSNLVKKSFEAVGFNERDISVVPLGVDTDIYFKEDSPIAIENCSIDDDSLEIGFVSSDAVRGGLFYLYNEWINLKVSKKHLHVRTNVMVRHPEVLNYKYLDTMKTLYSGIDLLVIPSAEDGFCMPVLEAMACEVPVMTTKNTGASELITHGVDGWVYDTPIECAQAIHKVYEDLGIDGLSNVGKRARITAQKYTWEVYRERFSNWARETINNYP